MSKSNTKQKYNNPDSSSAQIANFLKNAPKPFENSKEAWIAYCETNPDVEPSQIWFYRIFKAEGVRVTKVEKIANFLKALKAGEHSMKSAFEMYQSENPGDTTSPNYFNILFVKFAPKLKKGQKKTISLSEMTAKEIVARVKHDLRKEITTNVKNKAKIVSEARILYSNKGYKVAVA